MQLYTSSGEMRIFSLLTLVHILALVSAASASQWHPKGYAAPRALEPITIDGDIYKKAWEDVPWSQDFEEIRGDDSPVSARPLATNRTRVKIQWDDEYLYIAAEMTAHGGIIEAHFTERNEPIFQKDSDIEVFLDTDGSNANYKELEVNARNTVWNLMLNRPYGSRGEEHSGREHKPGDSKYWDVTKQKTSSKMFGGTFGKVNPEGKWTSEMKLYHKDSLDRTFGIKPAAGKFWRINFSRVEKKGKVNWVWSPQKLWNPAQGKYVGEVSMHNPDAWGYVKFVEDRQAAGPLKDWVDPEWLVKAAAHQLFYAEKHAMDPAGGGKLLSVKSLSQKNWINATLFEGLGAEVYQTSGSWKATIQDTGRCSAEIQMDNLFSYQCKTQFLAMSTQRIVAVLLAGLAGGILVVYLMSGKSGIH